MSKVVRDIELSFVYPPIPDRSCDWQATRKGYDEGDPIGRGGTPQAALEDLIEQEGGGNYCHCLNKLTTDQELRLGVCKDCM